MEDPYSTSGIDPLSRSGGSGVTQAVMASLAGTRPWVRFCSVLGFIATGFMVLVGLLMLVGGGFMVAAGDGMALPFAGFPALMGALYLVIAFFYFFPSLKLWKYGSHIAALLGSSSTTDLEAALEAQRSFWKFVGILLCIAIGLYIVGIIVGVLFFAVGVSSATSVAP